MVTGAARGIGRACVDAVAPHVDRVVVVDRDEASLDAVAGALGTRGVAFPADVTEVARLGALAAMVADLGTLRAVVHAAGVSPTMASWEDVVSVDLVGTARLLDALEGLVVPGTAGVVLASMAAQLVVPAGDPSADAVLDEPLADDVPSRLAGALGDAVTDPVIAYAWAKRGVQRLARRAAVRWGRRGGRLCSVSPGMVATPMGEQEAGAQPAMAGLLALAPVPRLARAEEIAAVAAFLVSDAATFLTGTDVLVDGGCVAAVEVAAGPRR